MPTLSDSYIRKDLKPGTVDKWESDGDGLNIRVRPNGTKTWVIRRKKRGPDGKDKTTIETIGKFPDMDCIAARAALAKRSFSPDLRKTTFGDLLDEWYGRRIEPRYRVTKNIKTYVERAKAEFGKTTLSRLTTPQLVRWLQKYAEKTPVAANRCASNLKQALGYACECGYLDRNPLQPVTNRVIGGEEKTRDRHLTDEEIRTMWGWEHKLLRFLLLTGLRISEAQAGYQDGDRFRVDHTKNGTPHWVFLPEITKAQIETFDKTPTGIQAWLRRKCETTKTQAFTPHDLRRTFATRLADLGLAPHIIEKCLNHRMQGVMGIYNRAEYEIDRIGAAQAWAAELSRILKAEPQGAPTPSDS
ncbi:MAG: tyrosine-type recombinase/integrase [Rhodocyclaceae bacterium]